MKQVHYILVAVLLFFITSCGTPKNVVYFQDVQQGNMEHKIHEAWDIKVEPNDKISIIVNSKDPLLTDLFNLPYVSRQIGTTSAYATTPQGLSGYTVNKHGNIDFPVLGQVRVAGMSREEIAAYIKNELVSRNLVKDPVVTVEFMNLTVSVLGEVNKPGRYNIERDKVTILDALSMAGDLTIYGERDNILVMREENKVQHVYKVNLCSAEDIYSSPVYYLRQNDVVYVEPNETRVRQSTVNGNNVRSTSFWISLASLLTSISLIFVK